MCSPANIMTMNYIPGSGAELLTIVGTVHLVPTVVDLDTSSLMSGSESPSMGIVSMSWVRYSESEDLFVLSHYAMYK